MWSFINETSDTISVSIITAIHTSSKNFFKEGTDKYFTTAEEGELDKNRVRLNFIQLYAATVSYLHFSNLGLTCQGSL